MAQHLREYQDLLNVKMALDRENGLQVLKLTVSNKHNLEPFAIQVIEKYPPWHLLLLILRKLLEGEETHFSTGMPYGAATHSVNYSYLPLPSAGSSRPPSPSSSRKSRKKDAAQKESPKEAAEVTVEKNEEADLLSNS